MDGMELNQLRYVLAVARTRNFTRAASECFVVQSALSHQIASLERELGVRLFARTSRRVEVTPAGEAFLPSAQACLDAADRAAAEAAAADGTIRGLLRVGLIPTVTAFAVPRVLRDLRERHPEVRVTMRNGASTELVDAVATGDLDVAVLGLPASQHPARVASRELARERLVAVVGSSHRLASRRRIRLRDLAEETFVDFPRGSSGRAQSDLAFAAAGLQRSVDFETMVVDTASDLVADGLAVTLLPAGVVPARDDLVAIEVSDGPVRVQHLAWSDFNPSPATRVFVGLVEALQDSGDVRRR